MARQRGSVKPSGDGRFIARYSAGADPLTGKRVQRWKTFDERKDAQQWLTAELHAVDSGEVQRRLTGGQSLSTFLREYYATDRRGLKGKTLSPRTCEIDLEMVERYVLKRAPALADTPLGRLTTEGFVPLFRSLANGTTTHAPLSKASVSRVYRILKARLSHAVKLGYLRANPMRSDLIPIDGKAARQQVTLNGEQIQSLLAVCPRDRYGLFFAVIAWTGLRPGEAAGLMWDDIDTEANVLVIRRALVRTKGHADIRGTKTGRTRRIPIPATLMAQLQGHRRQQAAEKLAAGAEYVDRGLVFCTVFGLPVHLDLLAARHLKPLLVQAAYQQLNRERPAVPVPSRSPVYAEALKVRDAADAKAMKDAAFPTIGLYSLRHSQATLLLRRGVHPKIAADRLGHARTSTTLDIYSHVTPDMQDQALVELEAALAPKLKKA